MTVPGAAPLPSEILPELIGTLDEASRERQTFENLNIQTKGQLALFGYFSTDPANAPHPGPYRQYHAQNNQERMLAKLAGNADRAMMHVPEYDKARQEGTLGLTMAAAYTAVRAVRHHGVHLADPKLDKGTVVDGVVQAVVTSYTVPDEPASTMLHTLFQGLHNKCPEEHIVKPRPASPDWQPPQDPWDPAWVPPKQTYLADGEFVGDSDPATPRPHIVEVTNLSEYQRIVTEAIRVLVRNELRAIGVVLPERKVPLKDWLQTETLPPEIKDWLQAIDATYNKMHESGFVQADYVDDPDGIRLRPGRRRHIIATDPSAVSKAERDEINGLAHTLVARGGDSRFNQEQHPSRHARYAIEDDVHLRRPRLPKEGVYYAPALARPLNLFERALIEMQETWHEVKENPERRIPEFLGEVAGKLYGDVLDLAISAGVLTVKGLIATAKGVRHHWHDLRAWRRQKQQAHSRLDVILNDLRSAQAVIAEQRIPDQFPDSSLPPSRQVELVKGMTAMMLANLSTEAA